jgi:hypothetical protein
MGIRYPVVLLIFPSLTPVRQGPRLCGAAAGKHHITPSAALPTRLSLAHHRDGIALLEVISLLPLAGVTFRANNPFSQLAAMKQSLIQLLTQLVSSQVCVRLCNTIQHPPLTY